MTLSAPNATAPERQLAAVVETAFDAIEVPVNRLWDADACPLALLPWLAWALSVDEWQSDWSEETKRAVIRNSAEVHRKKGTRWSVKRALKAAGFGDATIIEGLNAIRHDGLHLRNGSQTYGVAVHWATYRVIITRPVTLDQAASLRRILALVAPARCHLVELDFTQAAYRHNAVINRDGTASYGVA